MNYEVSKVTLSYLLIFGKALIKNMDKKIAAIFCIFLFLASFAFADLGPKPTVKISVTLDGQEIQGNFGARLLQCTENPKNPAMDPYRYLENGFGEALAQKIPEFDEKRNCYWDVAELAWPDSPPGPGLYKGNECSRSSCGFRYHIPNEFKIAVFLPDSNRLFISNAIIRTGFNSKYNLELSSSGSAVISGAIGITNNILAVIVALIITLFLELIVAFLFFLFFENKKIPKKVLVSVLVANIISVPIVQMVFPAFALGTFMTVVFAEVFAFVFEALLIFGLNKKTISLKNAFVLSFLMNLASFFIGGFIIIVLDLLFGLPFLF